MLSAPGADFWEGPKRRGAPGDAIFGNKYFPAHAHTPPIRPWTKEGSKTVFRIPPRQLCRAAPHCLWRRRHAESEPFRRLCAVDAVTIVHDLRDVTSVTSHPQTHENRMTSGGGRVTACICADELQRFISGGSCFHDTDDLPLRLATGVFSLVSALHAAADGSEAESYRGLHGCLVTISERFFLLSGRHSPRWEYPREEIWEAKRRWKSVCPCRRSDGM